MEHRIGIIVAFVRNVHLKRVMHDVDPEPHLNFWRMIHGNLLDVAVMEWCKLFGSDHEEHQPMHWKNVVPREEHEGFRAGLLNALGVPQKTWEAYWQQMKEYRDNHAAHFNAEFLRPENDPHYPEFDLALEAAYFYYDWILKDMRNPGVQLRYPEDIRDYCRRFSEQASEVATKAISSTADLEETVN